MDRQRVTSSNIASVGYDATTRTLEVEFTNGGTYQYADVPQGAYDGLVSAPSVGAFFHSRIRSQYRATRVSV